VAMATLVETQELPVLTPFALALRQALREGDARRVASFRAGGLGIEIRATGDSAWALIRREGKGGLALRLSYVPEGDFDCTLHKTEAGEAARIEVRSPLGMHDIVLRSGGEGLEHLRVTVSLTPATPMLVPFLPRDLYPLDEKGDPAGAVGHVEAAQRGLNAGLLYFRMEEPAFGNVLYFQNLTAMNDYYLATGTKPDGAVGGVWPELGYLVPTPMPGEIGPDKALEAGIAVTLSDAILVFRHDAPQAEAESARQFLQMLGVAYKELDLPVTDYRDWIVRADCTLRDLDEAPEATIRHYGHRYAHPYTAAEYPDIMVQMSLTSAIHDWGRWSGTPHPLEAEFIAGLSRFYDPKLKTLRRYLPNVGKDKDKDAVDSWYLYHPMLNLGRLALHGDKAMRRLFLKTVDFGVKAARHFNYDWPVMYKVTDFTVITENAGDDRGQTDVGGIYAWVMLQAYELTDRHEYLQEARAAIEAAMGRRFNLNYQANLTAWGAAACMRLWRITDDRRFLDQSYVYLASFFHNSEIWESEIAFARHYRNFLGVTCLQDAPYMAIYECFDSFAAFEHYLDDSGPDLEPAVRMLVAEYCKYALDRAWFYYPDALPKEMLATEIRNGHIDRTLSFPLEDLYPDGQPAGQVGQEVYGAGAAFVFATRSFHHVEGAPFLLHCNHFVRAKERIADKAMSISLDGGETCLAALSLIRAKRRTLPKARVTTAGGDVIRPKATTADRIDYVVPANGRIVLTWD
jgi:hypothetical protein